MHDLFTKHKKQTPIPNPMLDGNENIFLVVLTINRCFWNVRLIKYEMCIFFRKQSITNPNGSLETVKVHRKIQKPGPELVWMWVGGYVGGRIGNSVGWHFFIYLCLVFTECMQVSVLLRTTLGSDFQLFRLKCRSEVKVSEFKCQVIRLKCYKPSGGGTSKFLFLRNKNLVVLSGRYLMSVSNLNQCVVL